MWRMQAVRKLKPAKKSVAPKGLKRRKELILADEEEFRLTKKEERELLALIDEDSRTI